MATQECPTCGGEFEQRSGPGRPLTYCSTGCRARQRRRPDQCQVCPEGDIKPGRGGYCPAHYSNLLAYQKKGRLAKYGLSQDDFDDMLRRQGGGCAICGSTDTRLMVDHDHSCCPYDKGSCGECVRGVLCNHCNSGLGMFRDRPDLLHAAIQYLTREGI